MPDPVPPAPVASEPVAVLRVAHRVQPGDVCVVAVTGEIDMATAPVLEAKLAELAGAGHSRFVLDFSDARHCDSSGLSALLAFRRRLGDRGTLAVASPPPHLRAVFEIAGLEHALALAASVDAAVSGCRAGRDG